MPRSYRTSRTPRGLTRAQRWELLTGPEPARGEAFESDETRRRAYFKHEVGLRLAVNAGCRPWAWWEYRQGSHPDIGEPQREVLARLGLLSELEREVMGLPWGASTAQRREIAEVEASQAIVPASTPNYSLTYDDPRSRLGDGASVGNRSRIK